MISKKHIISLLFVLGFLVYSSDNISAQQQGYFSNIQYITSNEGLSQNEVTAIIQDRKGFLWIGTRGGLNRYDGSNIKVFQNEIGNANSLINNSIETLFEDSNGHIWIGTKTNGVSRYVPETDQFEQVVSTFEGLHEKNIISIEESSDNKIWLGTQQSGIYIYDLKTHTVRRIRPENSITNIIKTKDGKMWIGTPKGIFIYNKNGSFSEHINTGNVASMIEDKLSGIIYYVIWESGIYSLDPVSKALNSIQLIKQKSIESTPNRFHFIYQDLDRNIWIGSWGGGAFRYDINSKEIINFSLHSSQSKGSPELYNDVLNIFQDKLGTLWFGTNGGGLCKIDKGNNQFGYTSFNRIKNSLPNEPIWSILKDRTDRLWIGVKGNNHLFYSKNDTEYKSLEIQKHKKDNQLNIKNGIKSMHQDLDGNLWIGGNYSLAEVVETNSGFNTIPIDIRTKNLFARITTLHQTLDSIFWIGTQQYGLRKSVGPGNPKNQQFETHLDRVRISAFLETRNGQVWVGTYNGVHLYQKSTNDFRRYHKNTGKSGSLSSDIIICLFEDSQGNIWIGTPNGLNLAVRGINNTLTFKSLQVKDGLPNNYIHAILEDDQGNLWISTNKGLSKFNIKSEIFYNYDIDNGLQSNSFIERSALKDDNGKFYFGSNYGLNGFYPDSIKSSTTPEVILTSLKISGQEIHPNKKYNDRNILKKSIEYTSEIVLTHNENIFSIEYSALDLRSSSNSYSYKMEGLDKEWQTSTSQKIITYSNLNPGNYIFKVKTINDDFTSDTTETSLKITLLPPLWATWEAYVLYVLLFISLLYLYQYFITKQSILKNNLELEKLERKKEEELTKMKTQFFTDIAHEFRTPLSLISGPVETLLENKLNKEQRNDQLSTIQYHTKRLLSLIGQLLDFRKSESGKMTLQVAKGNFVNFTREIFLSFKDLAESKNIQFNFITKNIEIPLTYDRQKMEIVLCNLLSNAFKYSASTIDVSISIKGINSENSAFIPEFKHGYCEISVKDNGKGMSEDVTERIFDRFFQNSNSETINQIGTGIGLSLVKNIMELHKGNVFVKSKLNQGSDFIVQLPLKEFHFSKDQFITDFKKAEDPTHYQVERILSDFKETTGNIKLNLPTLLIVEDNPEIRSYIRIIFQSNYRVIEAENGLVGLEKSLKYIPEIIITDLMMPEMDGMTLCRELSANEQTIHIPIIMLTARTANIFKEKGYNSGADMFVTKPFNPTVLKAQVESLLKSRKKLKDYFGKKIALLPTETDYTSADQVFLNRVMKLVEDNLTNEKLNREFLASKMAVSPSTLYRKIKAITELDISIFIRSIRLKKAAQMILNKEDNISGISYHVGFNDPNYFRKCFVKQFGVNPSQFTKID